MFVKNNELMNSLREYRAAMSLDLSTFGEMVREEESHMAETSLCTARDNRVAAREGRK